VRAGRLCGEPVGRCVGQHKMRVFKAGHCPIQNQSRYWKPASTVALAVVTASEVAGRTRGDGGAIALIYEPYGLVHQWGNPGNEPLTFLAFNINPDGVAAVLPGAPAKRQ
jgi:hypothetical protein